MQKEKSSDGESRYRKALQRRFYRWFGEMSEGFRGGMFWVLFHGRGWEEPGGNIRNMAPERRTEPVVPVRLRQVPPVIAAGYGSTR